MVNDKVDNLGNDGRVIIWTIWPNTDLNMFGIHPVVKSYGVKSFIFQDAMILDSRVSRGYLVAASKCRLSSRHALGAQVES